MLVYGRKIAVLRHILPSVWTEDNINDSRESHSDKNAIIVLKSPKTAVYRRSLAVF